MRPFRELANVGPLQRGLTCLLVAAIPTTAGAQTVQSFDELTAVLKAGQSVVVTDEKGQKIGGQIVEVQSASLVLGVPRKDGKQFTFTEDHVSAVARRDSLANGTLIGLGVGALLSLKALSNCRDDPEACAYAIRIIPPVYLSIGALTGALIDRSIGNELLYRSGSQKTGPSLAFAPWLTARSCGLSMAVRF